jgi:hypothetical protein
LQYLRARYYGPDLGRFVSFDSFEADPSSPASLHKYLYANGNPVMNWDPSGKTTLGETLVTSSIIGGLTGMIVGGIRGGVRGAVVGAISGAIFAPVVTLGSVGLGLGIAAATGMSTTAGLFTSFALTTAGSMAWNTYDLLTAKNEREKLAAGVSMVFTLGFATYGTYKFSEIPSLPNKASSGGGLFPNSRENWGAWLSEAAAALRGERVVAREVTIDTPSGTRVRVDLVTRTLTGALRFIEAKFGPNARFTENQIPGYPEIAQSGGTVAGGNGAGAGLPAGTRIGPTQVQVDTWNGANP